MKAPWKIEAERLLMGHDSPSVLTTAQLRSIANAYADPPPAHSTFMRWMAEMVRGGRLKEVIRGVYLNRLGHRGASPAAAANWIRSRSVVGLSWVLEQAHITNNFGDTVTCVIPTDANLPTPQISDRQTAAGPFRFFAMPAALVDERAGRFEDIRDLRFDYPRTTPEKAFLDWIFLGASHKSRLTRPPYDLDVASLDAARIERIARAMQVEELLAGWMSDYQLYQQDEEVRENSAKHLRL